jgi:hypothetical protein
MLLSVKRFPSVHHRGRCWRRRRRGRRSRPRRRRKEVRMFEEVWRRGG